MNTTAKLAVFGAALATLFGAAALAGGAVEPLHDPVAAAEGGMAMEADAVRGLAVSDNDLTLQLDRSTAPRGKAIRLSFRIRDDRGAVVRAFDVEHTKRMHLIAVRRDFTDFQHLHPVEAADGTWSVPLTLHDAGSYRVFADFAVRGDKHTLADDIQVDGPVTWRSLPAPASAADADGYRVRRVEAPTRAGVESALRFRITRGGVPIQPQNYLGAKGHLVALRQGDLAFLHVHPDENTLRFMATFPTPGAYRMFLQFKVDGRVHTAAFTQEVTR